MVSAARFLEALTAPLWFGCCVSHPSGQLSTRHHTNVGSTSSWFGHGNDSLHSFHPLCSVFRCPVRHIPRSRLHRASLRRAGQGWICSWCCTTCVGCTVLATVGEDEAKHGLAASVDRGVHCCGASSTPLPVISSTSFTFRPRCNAYASWFARAPTCCGVDLKLGRIGAFLDLIEPKRLPPGGPDPAPTDGEKGSPFRGWREGGPTRNGSSSLPSKDTRTCPRGWKRGWMERCEPEGVEGWISRT